MKTKTTRSGSVNLNFPMTVDELLALSSLFWGPLLHRDKYELRLAIQTFQEVWDRFLSSPEGIDYLKGHPTPEQSLVYLREILNKRDV
jgi:hypothetical protein